MNKKKTVRGWVAGRVQGVNYRASMLQMATRSGITGWVRNLSDGRVAFLIHGDADKVEKLLDWARHGPLFARVDEIHIDQVEDKPSRNFEIKK